MTSTPSPAQQGPRDRKRRAEILEVAGDLFLSAGYSGTTMSLIADAAGVLPGSLYHHFSSKEEIAVELLTAYNDHAAELAKTVATTGSPEDRLEDFAVRNAELSLQHTAAVRLRAFDAPTTATARMTEALAVNPPSLIRAWQSLADDVARDAEPPVDTPLLAFSLQTLTRESATVYDAGDVEPAIQRLCAILLRGLAKSAPADRDLDESSAMHAAVRAVQRWGRAEAEPTDDRAMIIAAARSEFSKRGYDATTIRDIAAAAGMRMGTMYRRIDSKETMLQEILTAYTSRLSEATEAIHAVSSSAVETIDALAYLFLHTTRRFRAESDIVTSGWGMRDMSSSPFHDYLMSTHRRLALLEKIVERGLRDGTLNPVGTSPQIAQHIRQLVWLRYHHVDRASASRAQQFIRRSALRATLA